LSTLYVSEQGARLGKSSDRFILTRERDDGTHETVSEVPARRIDQVLLMGRVQITNDALRECMEHGIELAFTTLAGRVICQLTPPLPKSLGLRLRQYDTFRDIGYCLASARNVVRNRGEQNLSLIRYYRGNGRLAPGPREPQQLRRLLAKLDHVTSLDGLLGLEGALARVWYRVLARLLPGWTGFAARTRRPPQDPANALLSLGYSLATTELNGLIDAVGLDPHLGFYHQPEYGRPSLALDLVEEFRSPLVDRFVITLLNREQFTAADFEERSGGVLLKRKALKRFLGLWEERQRQPLSLPWGAPDFDRSFRQAIWQCRRCLSQGVPYLPLPLDAAAGTRNAPESGAVPPTVAETAPTGQEEPPDG
jgi:CRISPR-associated protein Cas1